MDNGFMLSNVTNFEYISSLTQEKHILVNESYK